MAYQEKAKDDARAAAKRAEEERLAIAKAKRAEEQAAIAAAKEAAEKKLADAT